MDRYSFCVIIYVLISVVVFGHAHANGDCKDKPEFRSCSDQITGEAIGSAVLWPFYISKELWKNDLLAELNQQRIAAKDEIVNLRAELAKLDKFKDFVVELADKTDCEQGEFGRGYDCANREFYQAVMNWEPNS